MTSPTITVHYEITIGSKDYSGWANFDIASYAGEDLKFSGSQPSKANSQFLEGINDWRSLLALNANLSYGDLGFLSLSEMTSDEDNDDTSFGLFDEEDNLKYTWSKLINFGLIAMEDTKITSVSKYLSGKLIIPDTVTEIGNRAFSECGELTEINIPESVTNIGYYAFSECYLLSKINIPKSITDIPDGMFNWCRSLVDYEIPTNTTSIGAYAFYRCGIKYADIPDGVTVIPKSAFSCSKIKTLILPVSISKIETDAFSYVGFDDHIQILYKGTESQWNEIKINSFAFYDSYIDSKVFEYSEQGNNVQCCRSQKELL